MDKHMAGRLNSSGMCCEKCIVYLLLCCVACVLLCTASIKREKNQMETNFQTSRISDIRSFLHPSNEVDLVLMIDSSKGMGKSLFYTTEKPILRAIIRQYAVIMPDRVRLAAITFAVRTDVVFDYISTGEMLHKCELFWGEEESIWGQIRYFDDPKDNKRTEMLEGLDRASDIFTTGKERRPNATQILLITTDANITTADYTSTIDKAEYLRDSGIHIFTIGTGTWVKPVNGASISSPDYFDFSSSWEDMLIRITPFTTFGPDDPDLFQGLLLNGSYCGSCRANAVCYCDPYTGKTVCKCDKGHFYEKSGEQEACSPCSRHEFKDTAGSHPCTNCPPPSYTEITGASKIDQCLCPEGFSCTGECIPNPCGVNSQCKHSSVDNIKCTCLSGWEDAYNNTHALSMKISCTVHTENNCDNDNCENGATCVDMDGDYFCVCPFGYIGDLCETEKDLCDINFCQNGGTCTSRLNGFICECTYGFKGTYCTEIGDTTTISTHHPPATSQTTTTTTINTNTLNTLQFLNITSATTTTQIDTTTSSTTIPFLDTIPTRTTTPTDITTYSTLPFLDTISTRTITPNPTSPTSIEQKTATSFSKQSIHTISTSQRPTDTDMAESTPETKSSSILGGIIGGLLATTAINVTLVIGVLFYIRNRKLPQNSTVANVEVPMTPVHTIVERDATYQELDNYEVTHTPEYQELH